MQGYGVNIVVEGGELGKILARLSAAQEEIQQCYFELERLGVLVIKKPSDESDGKRITDPFPEHQQTLPLVLQSAGSVC